MSPTPSQLPTPAFKNEDLPCSYWDGQNQKVVNLTKKLQWFELYYNGHALKYTVQIFGVQPAEGYPLFIGFHGGGTDYNGTSNNYSWYDASTRYFSGPVATFADENDLLGKKNGAVLVVPRGVSARTPEQAQYPEKPVDSYMLHSEPESYPLLEQLIRNLFAKIPLEVNKDKQVSSAIEDYSKLLDSTAPYLVNPNRVFLVGYSAGGNGVFQLSQRISDRFAAVNAGAGHHEWTNFINVANLPICLQVGEKDNKEEGYGINFDRAAVYANINKTLDELPAKLGNLTAFHYRHICYMVRGQGHLGGWHQPNGSNQLQDVIKNVGKWLENRNSVQAQEIYVPQININPQRWVNNYRRNSAPSVAIWDLETRPEMPEGMTVATTLDSQGWQPKRFSYWLYLRSPQLQNKERLRAEYNRDAKTINVPEPTWYLALLFNETMLPFNTDIAVWVAGVKLQQPVKLTASQTIKDETWKARGDPRFIFSAVVYFERSGTSWIAKTATSLASIEVQDRIASKL